MWDLWLDLLGWQESSGKVIKAILATLENRGQIMVVLGQINLI